MRLWIRSEYWAAERPEFGLYTYRSTKLFLANGYLRAVSTTGKPRHRKVGIVAWVWWRNTAEISELEQELCFGCLERMRRKAKRGFQCYSRFYRSEHRERTVGLGTLGGRLIYDSRWYSMPEHSHTQNRHLCVALGSDTTAIAMSAIFFYLAHYPEVYNTLANEIRHTFSDLSQIRSGPALISCSYLSACITETMHICPPVPGIPWREIESSGTLIDGEQIPAGYNVGT